MKEREGKGKVKRRRERENRGEGERGYQHGDIQQVENLVRDTVESLRPQMEWYKTPQEAYEAALELEKKYRDKIGQPVVT